MTKSHRRIARMRMKYVTYQPFVDGQLCQCAMNSKSSPIYYTMSNEKTTEAFARKY